MNVPGQERRTRTAVGRLLLAAALIGLGPAPQATAQMLPPGAAGETAGGPVLRPTVPLAPPRPAEAGAARWDRNRPPADNAPTATFIESLKGSDAALEVLVGQGRILTTRDPLVSDEGGALVAIGDPSVLAFEILPSPNPRMIRLWGLRAGVTDLTIVTAADETFVFEVHVVYDLPLLHAQLQRLFPDAWIQLTQFREHVVLEGQARSPAQIVQIQAAVEAFLESVQVASTIGTTGRGQPAERPPQRAPEADASDETDEELPEDQQPRPGEPPPETVPETGGRPSVKVRAPAAMVINLMRVPGLIQRQVMLQVRVAELNRTGLREIGADMIFRFDGGEVLETLIGGAPTAVFQSSNFSLFLQALRQNGVATILAEPNLTALDGHRASFLSGGQFPVPIQQAGVGAAGAVTIEWKDFGVQLDFVPTILDDRTVRLHVAPEVSGLDQSVAVTLVPGGEPIPGVTTRRVETTVELQEGQTLVLAGLLNVEVTGQTQRIPFIGDLPYVGPLFSSTRHQRREVELLVIVTPFIVSPLEPHQVPCLPGTDVTDPNDLEFYLLNRIEGRRGREFRSTTAWDDPLHLVPLLHLERDHVYGPAGFSP